MERTQNASINNLFLAVSGHEVRLQSRPERRLLLAYFVFEPFLFEKWPPFTTLEPDLDTERLQSLSTDGS